MELIIWCIILVVSLYVLLKSADYFIIAAEKIGIYYGISTFIIGVTVVSIDTSLSELLTSIIAVIGGSSEIVVGDVIGSNIFNTFAVMGIPALFGTLVVLPSILYFSLPIMVLVTLLYFFIAQDKNFTKWEGWPTSHVLCIFYR